MIKGGVQNLKKIYFFCLVQYRFKCGPLRLFVGAGGRKSLGCEGMDNVLGMIDFVFGYL